MEPKKFRYIVRLTYHGEDHKFYTTAFSSNNALRNACAKMAKKFGILSPSHFLHYFNGERDNFSILKIVDKS